MKPARQQTLRQTLQQYHQMLQQIRDFFAQRAVLEVRTPMLSPRAISDVYIDSLKTTLNTQLKAPRTAYLHTSPELEMKRLLLDGSGDIYQICAVFRDNEQGRVNRNEFTMLEWYREDLSLAELLAEVAILIQQLLPIERIQTLTYAQIFARWAGIDNIYSQTFEQLTAIAHSHQLTTDLEDLAQAQLLLFVHLIEPKLAQMGAVFIVDYPKEQAGLAALGEPSFAEGAGAPMVALRFELYVAGVELANGCQELAEMAQYKARFVADIAQRKQLNKAATALDEDFLAAFESSNSPTLARINASGVAIGLERVFMLKQGKNRL